MNNTSANTQNLCQPDDWVEIMQEESILLKDAQPPELAVFCRYFIDFFPRKCFHVKYDYRGGFIQRKRKATDKPLPLFPAMLDQALERHLDSRRYYDHHRLRDPNKTPPCGPFWLALHAPKKTALECADLDNRTDQGKNVVGYYTCDEITRPVVRCPLEFVQKLYRFWSHFPGRIWCISSETLGIHAWKKLPARRPLHGLHDTRRDQLAQVGLVYESEVEIHPNPHRCLRRPFGLDYRTITDAGVLSDWREQVRFFDQFATDDASPSFPAIVQALGDALARQRENWFRHARKPKKLRSKIDDLKNEWNEVLRWVETGCQTTAVCVVPEDVVLSTPLGGQRRPRAAPASSDGVAGIVDLRKVCRDHQWVQTIKDWAVNGLPGPNTIRSVVQELAEWLCWVEFHDNSDRQQHVASLLWTYVLNKNNGHVSRLNDRNHKAVKGQVGRIVKSVLKKGDNRVWQELREKRGSGEYREVIYLAPWLASTGAERQKESSCSGPIYSVSTPLPETVLKMIRAKAGQCQVVPFAEKLLWTLHQQGGKWNLSQETLLGMLGYPNKNQMTKYKKILLKAGVISQGKYVPHRRCREYTLLVNLGVNVAAATG